MKQEKETPTAWRQGTFGAKDHYAVAGACAAILAFAAPQAGAAISFIEGEEFPLSPFNPAVIETPLGPGANVVSGSLPGHDTTPDVDVFRLQNPSGLSVISIAVSFSSFV